MVPQARDLEETLDRLAGGLEDEPVTGLVERVMGGDEGPQTRGIDEVDPGQIEMEVGADPSALERGSELVGGVGIDDPARHDHRSGAVVERET